MGGWFDVFFRLLQASESMSFLRWAEGGMESMLSEAVTIRLQLLCTASHRFPLTHIPPQE